MSGASILIIGPSGKPIGGIQSVTIEDRANDVPVVTIRALAFRSLAKAQEFGGFLLGDLGQHINGDGASDHGNAIGHLAPNRVAANGVYQVVAGIGDRRVTDYQVVAAGKLDNVPAQKSRLNHQPDVVLDGLASADVASINKAHQDVTDDGRIPAHVGHGGSLGDGPRPPTAALGLAEAQ